jgi:Predicted membrane protein (DUF2127)
MQPSAPSARKRPPGMVAVTLLLCVFAVAAIAFYQRSPNLSPRGSIAFFAAGYAVYAAVSFVVIWFLWQGRNWARWLVIAGSLLALSNLLNFGSWNSVQQVLVVVEAVFGAWLLYWLNTEKVARFFRRGGTVVAG